MNFKLKFNQIQINKVVGAIEKNWVRDMSAKSSTFERTGTILHQNAIKYLRAYKDGGLTNSAKMQQVALRKTILWRFTVNVDYYADPREGFDLNAPYGIRKFDVLASSWLIKRENLKLKSVQEPYGRRRGLKLRDENIPPLTNI